MKAATNQERRKSGKGKRKILKSAVTGKFVSKKYAKRHPRSTFVERIRSSDRSSK